MNRIQSFSFITLVVIVALSLPVVTHAGRFFDGYSIAADWIVWNGSVRKQPKRTIEVQLNERCNEDDLRLYVFEINAWADTSKPFIQAYEMYHERLFELLTANGDTLYPTPIITFHYPQYMPPDPQIYATGKLTTDPATGEQTARVHILGMQADKVDQIRQEHVRPEGCVASYFSEWSASWYDIIKRDGSWFIGGVGPLVQESDSTFNYIIEENGNRIVMETFQLLNGGDVLYVPGGDGVPPDYARLVKP